MWGSGPGWGMMGGWGGETWGPFGMVIWLLILGAVIAGIVWLVRSASDAGIGRLHRARRPSGLDVLEERYARGEINRDEYLQKKRDISD